MPVSSALGVGGLKPGVCTSATRPNTPYEGQVIYEVDTKRTLIWNSVEWMELARAENISNTLINGGMEIWQRGTSSSNATTTYNTNTSYRADRWYVLPAGATVTMQQSTSVPTNKLSRYSLLVTGATSATTVKIGQRIEAANIPQITRRVTFAAWIYNETGASFQPDLLLGTPSASDNFTTVNNRLTQQLIPCANNEWTEVSWSVDISAYTDLANGLQVELQIPSGSMNANTKKVYVTQVRLTPTANVVPFQRLGVDQELRRCQRYFQSYGTNEISGDFYGQVASVLFRDFVVEMRASPAVTLPSAPYTNAVVNWGVTTYTPNNVQQNSLTVKRFTFLAFGGFNAGTAAGAGWVGGTFSFSAEI